MLCHAGCGHTTEMPQAEYTNLHVLKLEANNYIYMDQACCSIALTGRLPPLYARDTPPSSFPALPGSSVSMSVESALARLLVRKEPNVDWPPAGLCGNALAGPHFGVLSSSIHSRIGFRDRLPCCTIESGPAEAAERHASAPKDDFF